MTDGSAAPTPAGASTYDWLTTANLIAIAVFAVIVVIAILWGARLKAKRKGAETELREEATVVADDHRIEEAAPRAATPAAPVATPAPSTHRPADSVPAPSAEPAGPTDTPEVAPPPAPLADTPIAAAAPFDAAPATIAADLATPPDQPTTGADDLTRLKGVGPKLAARLTELDVTRFDQIAALSPADAEALDAQLGTFRGRLLRDRWIEQAGYLARDDRDGFEAEFGKL